MRVMSCGVTMVMAHQGQDNDQQQQVQVPGPTELPRRLLMLWCHLLKGQLHRGWRWKDLPHSSCSPCPSDCPMLF